MKEYLDLFLNSFTDYANYLWREISEPASNNYFYWLLGLSFLVFMLEIWLPWRKNQKILRRDFWLDLFYLVFNFFLFSLVGYNAVSNVAVKAFNDVLNSIGMENIVAFEIGSWPFWSQLLVMFIIADFIQWNVHRLLHRVPFLWEFHKVHHSVKEMGFAAHFRFHFMETILYKSLQYIPLAMIGFGIEEFFIVHMLGVLIGHLNHANLAWDYGPFKYVLNNPKMHLWHHAKELPADHKYGMNYGLSLSIWDYLFGTAHVPYHDPDLELGFEGDENFPNDLGRQMTEPFKVK
ncbi:Sterol desaturase/sphingolipid hydroxylase, fatty acid hydroxylase superfamily [Nonlabens sp. Hel1_33_55]|uniref:sterol desaturase family protein n=1 Tax=Nonlabens sp. Hel1_33_55 TaxID=1336802 RepID=UPI000875E84D|nr:sterol desaturase family protein [Nonlabens sp. Hel1_33_55]SCX97945.1 Sterol desaturase/sphingolipid hydroxylase, fatty acid hydroxylase superfamily [Nonlabens sp. Hel1_33_55]